jgi:hypothetical protein
LGCSTQPFKVIVLANLTPCAATCSDI